MKELLKLSIRDFQLKLPLQLFERIIDIPEQSDKIITLIGARRVGKTYLLYQQANQAAKLYGAERVVYINFEDERFQWDAGSLQLILDAYLELYPKQKWGDVYFFFDEVQMVDQWEKFVNRVYQNFSKNVFVTGSSAKLLSREIASTLRGRTIAYSVYPFSFREFVCYHLGKVPDINSSRSQAELKNLFVPYQMQGGYPEVVAQKSSDVCVRILQSYAEVMMYRDVLERNQVKQLVALKYFIQRCVANVAQDLSVNKVFNELKSQGVKIGKDTIYEFPHFLEDAYFFFYLEAYNASLIKRKQSIPKSYIIDTGLANALSFRYSEDRGRLLENMVFIELKRREQEIFYHKKNQECDFLLYKNQKIQEAIQVTDDMSDQATRKREFNGLIEAMNKYDLQEGHILTFEEAGEEIIDGRKIKITPIWKWLLAR